MVKRKNKKGGGGPELSPMEAEPQMTQAAAAPPAEPMDEEQTAATAAAPPPPAATAAAALPPAPYLVPPPLQPLTRNPPSDKFLDCLTFFNGPPRLKKAIIQFMVADSKHDMNFTLKDYDKIFAALMLLPNFPQTMINGQSIEQYINDASTKENLHTRLLKIINQYTGENADVNVLKELDEDSQIHSYSPDLYRILNDKSTSVDFEKVNIHDEIWLFQKYVMRNSGGEFYPAQVLASIRDLHGPPLPTGAGNEYKLLLSLDDATFLSKIKKNINSLNQEAIRRSQTPGIGIQEIYTLNVLLLHENLMDPGSSFNPRDVRITVSDNPRIFINMIRPDQQGNITINDITIYGIGNAEVTWAYQQGQPPNYGNGFFSRATVNAGPIRKSGNNYSSNITITAPGQIVGAAAEPDDINYQYTATTGADATSNCRKFLKTMLTSIATLCMDRTRKNTTSIFQKLMKDSLLMQSKRMGDTGLGLIFLRLKQQLGPELFNQLGKPVCSTIDRLAALSYNMMGINYMFFMRGGDQLEYYTCIREANIQTPEQREEMYKTKLIELKQKIISLPDLDKSADGNIDIYTIIGKISEKINDIEKNINERTMFNVDLRIETNFSDKHKKLKEQLYKIYIIRKKERFFGSILKKAKGINKPYYTIITTKLLFEIYSLIYQVYTFDINSFINPEGSEENYSMFLEIENAYYDLYTPPRRGRSANHQTPADEVNIPEFSTIKLLFNKLNINQTIYNYYLSIHAPGTKIYQYHRALEGDDIDTLQNGGAAFSFSSITEMQVIERLIIEIDNIILELDKPETNIVDIIPKIKEIIKIILPENKYDYLYLDINSIIENAKFELGKYFGMNEFRIKKFKYNEEYGYCNKKLNQYIDERNQLIDILRSAEITDLPLNKVSLQEEEEDKIKETPQQINEQEINNSINETIKNDIDKLILYYRENKKKKLNKLMIRTQTRRKNPNLKQTSQLNGTTRRAKKKIKENQEKRRKLINMRRPHPPQPPQPPPHSQSHFMMQTMPPPPHSQSQFMMQTRPLFVSAVGGRKSKKNKNNKRKTRKSKNKLRKTKKRKNRQDKK